MCYATRLLEFRFGLQTTSSLKWDVIDHNIVEGAGNPNCVSLPTRGDEPGTYLTTSYTLDQWRLLTGQERYSVALPAPGEAGSMILLNPALAPKSVDLGGQAYVDIRGYALPRIVTLAPFGSLIVSAVAGASPDYVVGLADYKRILTNFGKTGATPWPTAT